MFADRRAAEFRKQDLVVCAHRISNGERVDSRPYRRPVPLDLFADAADEVDGKIAARILEGHR